MMTRRIFLKNGSLALVSLGFTPAFIARAAHRPRAGTRSSSPSSSAAPWTA
jgi:hypothetical protein